MMTNFKTNLPSSLHNHPKTRGALIELNSNLNNNFLDTHHQPTYKRHLRHKRSIQQKALKLQHQTSKNTNKYPSNSSQFIPLELSNIALLKKQIQYLNQDKFTTQQFPNEDIVKNQPIEEVQDSNIKGFKLHQLQQFMAQNNKSVLLSGISNIFSNNFFMGTPAKKSIEVRRHKTSLSTRRKASTMRKYSSVQSVKNTIDMEVFLKTMQNRGDLPSGKNKNTHTTLRPSSCAGHLVGKKMSCSSYQNMMHTL